MQWLPASAGAATRWVFFTLTLPMKTRALLALKRQAKAWTAANIRPRCNAACPGVLHGNRTYVLQDEDGQVTETHSISAGLDYPGVGPEHAFLKDIGRAEYVGITDKEALDAFHYLCRTEGIIPALESAHAVAYAMKLAETMRVDQSILVNLSGRGDKDIGTVADLSNADFYCRPSCKGQSAKGSEQIIGFAK